jgi:hypothetical protein
VLPVPDHDGAGARKVSQGLKTFFGLAFLHDSNHHHDDDEAEQHQRVLRLADEQVYHAADDEEQEHRFREHLEDYFEKAPLVRVGQFVAAVFHSARRDLVVGKPFQFLYFAFGHARSFADVMECIGRRMIAADRRPNCAG